MNSYHKGKWAELLARLYLMCHGYRFVCRNYVTGHGTTAGEVDLIMKKNKTLVFVEVKLRKNLFSAAYAISKAQQQRILRGALSFIKKHRQYADYDLRFDAVLICFPFGIYHIMAAWSA